MRLPFLIFLVCIASFFSCTKVPWGMRKALPNVYVDDTEITSGEWLEFVYYSNLSYYNNYKEFNVKIPDLKLLKPDTSMFPVDSLILGTGYESLFQTSGGNKMHETAKGCSRVIYLPISEQIFKTQNIDSILDIPIVGISFNQIEKFCDWRTSIERIKNGRKNWKISLITKEEYFKISVKHDSISKNCGSFNYKNFLICNDDKIQAQILTYIDKPLHVASFRSNTLSLYDVLGNVGEITAEKEIYGGSFKHFAGECRNSIYPYEKPDDWIGFRTKAIIEK